MESMRANFLYPPRNIPNPLRRTYQENCILLCAKPVEEHIPFSGHFQDSNGSQADNNASHYHQLIGKQSIYQELDITVSPSKQLQHQAKIDGGNISVNCNQGLKFSGSALWTNPSELRLFFWKLVTSQHQRQLLSHGQQADRVFTKLSPFTLATYSAAPRQPDFDSRKKQLFSRLVSQASVECNHSCKPRFSLRRVSPPSSLSKTSHAIRLPNLATAEDSDEEPIKPKKKAKQSKNSDGEEGEEGSEDSSEEEADDDDDNGDYSYQFDNDGDDDIGGDSGEDEPTY